MSRSAWLGTVLCACGSAGCLIAIEDPPTQAPCTDPGGCVPPPNCTHFASPGGTGDGTSAESAMTVAAFWKVAQPGDTLCLLDGRYTGGDAMIDPPEALAGAPGKPITVVALHDGGALIDGEGQRKPVLLYLNDWFVVAGINACCSSGRVVELAGANDNIIRRVAAWDAADSNTRIFSSSGGDTNLFEDVAGWGIARGIFAAADGRVTFRRAWGRWEGSHVVSPKSTYSLDADVLVENALGTWTGERMQESYTLLDFYGQPWLGPDGTDAPIEMTNFAVDQPYAIFAGSSDAVGLAESKLLGSIAYVEPNKRFAASQEFFFTGTDGIEIADSAAFLPADQSDKKPLLLAGLSGGGALQLIARDLTTIGGAASVIDTQWQTSNIAVAQDASAVGDIYTSPEGAQICKRSVDSVLTETPLWPWPMGTRIAQALELSGRAAIDVTATIETLFGPIPDACRDGSK